MRRIAITRMIAAAITVPLKGFVKRSEDAQVIVGKSVWASLVYLTPGRL